MKKIKGLCVLDVDGTLIEEDVIDLPDDFIISLLVHYVIANIEVWITQENPLPPQVFKEKFLTLVHSSLDQYISLDKDNHID